MELMLLTSIKKGQHTWPQRLSQVMITAAQHWWFLSLSSLASFLTCWHLSTTSQVTIELVPPQVVEGEDVLFLVHKLPENLIGFCWYKGSPIIKHGIALYEANTKVGVAGPMYSARETLYRNGSMLIHNVTQKDTGFYRLRIFNRHRDTVLTSTFLHVNRKWFSVNSGCCWVVVIPLNIHRHVQPGLSLPSLYIASHVEVWVFSSATDQNLSFDLSSLKKSEYMLHNSAKIIRVCLDSWFLKRNMSLRKTFRESALGMIEEKWDDHKELRTRKT